MSITSDDLDDYGEKFRNMFFEQNNKKVNEYDMWSLIENLTKEIEISKEHETTLQRNLKLCLENDDTNITTKYVTLREKFDHKENENADLKNQLDNLQIQMNIDAETQKKEYLNKITELEETHKRKIINLQNQIESDRICYETKEKELYNELQLAQASTALQCDEIESNLQRQIIDANNKLRQAQNIIRSLQMDIHNLRNQLGNQQCTPYYQKPEKPVLKYQPLPVTKSIQIHEETEELEASEFVEAPMAHNFAPVRAEEFVVAPVAHNFTPVMFKGTNLPKTRKHIIPPLKQCSDVETKKIKTVQRKRKLYNPESFECLEELEERK